MFNRGTVSTRTFIEWPYELRSDVLVTEAPVAETHPEVAALLRRKRFPFDSDECQQERHASLTATNFNSIVHKSGVRGENKYKSLKKLLKEKRAVKRTMNTNPAIEHGIYYEAEALRVYTLVTGNALVEEEIGFVKCDLPGFGFIGATPDAVCKYLPVLVEVKCPFWKKNITHSVPDIYWPQLMIQCLVTSLNTVHFVQYVPPSLTRSALIDIVEVHFDPEWWAAAAPLALKAHEELLAGPPPPTPKKTTRRPSKRGSVKKRKREKKPTASFITEKRRKNNICNFK